MKIYVYVVNIIFSWHLDISKTFDTLYQMLFYLLNINV